MNNRTILLTLVLLLAVYGLTRLFSGPKEDSFQSELIQIDTALVTSMIITPKTGERDIILKREEKNWIASQGEKNTRALTGVVEGMLAGLNRIETSRITANSPNRWKEYGVEEGLGVRVRVYRESELLEDFILGRFAQNNQPDTSYLRLTGEDEVYAVDGFLNRSFNQHFDTFRDKRVLHLQRPMEVTDFVYEFPDTAYQFARTETGWILNGEVSLDSITVENYLNGLRNLSGDSFADDFDELQAPRLETRRLLFSGSNLTGPFEVILYRDSTRVKPFVLQSSQNPDAYFASDSAGLFRKLFPPVESFSPRE